MSLERGPINYFAQPAAEQARVRAARADAEATIKQLYPHEPSGRRRRKAIAAVQLANLYETSNQLTEDQVNQKHERAEGRLIQLFERS